MSKNKDLTAADKATRAEYEQTAPKFLGTLHERMKLVMEALRTAGPAAVSKDIWNTIHDLEVEVSYTVPADPPFGSRNW